MEIIVKSKYDSLSLLAIIRIYIAPQFKNYEEIEVEDGIRIFGTGMNIVIKIVPEYRTHYKLIMSDAALDKINRIKEILEE